MSATVDPRGPIGSGDVIGTDPGLGGNPFTPIGGGSSGGISLPPAVASKPPSTSRPNVNSTRSPNDGVVQDGSRLWMRKWKLTVGSESGKGLDLSRLDFEFSVEQQMNVTPWQARIKVWNPNEEIISRIGAKELSHVSLEAGYQEPSQQYGSLFIGQISYIKAGRQDAIDTFVEIHAFTNSTAINAAVVNTWLPAGHQAIDSINAVKAAMAPFGVTGGQISDDLSQTKAPRGRLMFGMARDILRDIERTEKGHFFSDNSGRLHFLKDADVLKMGSETVPILNKKTGLIDIPTRTIDGAVDAQCFLNPKIVPGTRIKINNKDLANTAPVKPDQFIQTAEQFSQQSITVKGDGYYRVGHVRHQGQNRGNPWYSHITTEKAIQEPGFPTSAM